MSQQNLLLVIIRLIKQGNADLAIFILDEEFSDMLSKGEADSLPYIIKKGEYGFMHKSNIVRAEAKGSYTIVYERVNGKNIPHSFSHHLGDMQTILELLGLVRVHESHMVHKKYIGKFFSSGLIIMDDGKEVSLSKTYLQGFKAYMNLA